ncbi:MAG TPA: PKD domain-containing protein, partial [Chryseolinea sp.]
FLEYAGAEGLALEDGRLTVRTSVGDVIEQKPVAYQWIDGRKVSVQCQYFLDGNRVSFCFPEGYDPCYTLIIDPLLIFSTYSGSLADNWGSTATPAENGNLYSAGVTSHLNAGGTFPSTPGAFQTSYAGLYDIGILKYDSAGTRLLYATYLGGENSESPHSLVVNANNELIVLGTTSSTNFPTSPNAIDRTFNGGVSVTHVVQFANGSDIFVCRINKDGSQLLGATFLGGSQNDGLNPPFGALTKNYGDELRGDIITDNENNIYISSVTASNNFPVTRGRDSTYNGGETDAILIKLNPNLSRIVWSTFLGGSGADASHTLKLDSENGIFLAGGTTSADFPVKSSAYQTVQKGDADGWIAHMNSEGDSLYNATYTGTDSFDQIYFLDINESEEVYVYGQTSGNFPITPGVYHNPNSGQFVQKFNSSLSSLIFSTVFGSGRGIPDISPTAFLVNECNNLYMSGWGGVVNIQSFHWQSNTLGMPITGDAFQPNTSGSDFYFMVLTDDATEFLYGTYLGGTQSTTHVDGGTSRFDKGGVVYHAVCAGCAAYNSTGQSTSDFPTSSGAWSRINRSGNCNNAAFKFDLSSLKARLQSNSVRLDMPGLSKVCIPDTIVFQNFSTGGEIFEWDLGDGTRVVKTDTSMVPHRYKAPGRYAVWLKAIDPGTCKVKDSASVRVDIFIAQGVVQDDDALCLGTSYQLKATGAQQYSWRSEDGTFKSNLEKPLVSPTDTTRYFVTLNESSGCVRYDTVDLAVIVPIVPELEIGRSAECFNRPKVTVKNVTDSLREGDYMYFDFGDGVTSDLPELEHEFKQDGLYPVKLVGVREFCVTENNVAMPVFKLFIPNVITPSIKDEANDTFAIQFGDEKGATPGDYGFKTALTIFNRWGEKVFESPDYQYDWDGGDLPSGVYFYEISVDGHATCKSWLHLMK